jgi:hypothetical protein
MKVAPMAHHDVPALTEPNLNLAVRQEGNVVYIGLGLPNSSGSVNQSPFLEVTRNEGNNLLNGARTAFLERLNGAGIEFRDITASQSQRTNVGGELGGTLPVRGIPLTARGEVAIEITSQVSGGVNFRSGRVGEAITAAERNYDHNRREAYQDRAYEWAQTANGVTARNPAGDTFFVSPDVARTYHNNRFPIPFDPRRVDAGDGTSIAAATDPMRASIRDGVSGLDLARLGVTDRQQTANLVAALDQTARAGGLTHVDTVVASPDGQRVFAVQGDPNRPDHQRASVEVAAATRQPVDLSDRLIRDAASAHLAVEPQLQEQRSRGLG